MGKKSRQARLQPGQAVSSGPRPSPQTVPDAPAPAARGSLTGWRRNLARAAVAGLGPLVVLTLLELGLRLVGYGHPTSLFVRMEDGETLTTNRRFLWRFMKRETGVPPYPLVLPATKPPGTIRVFVLGESAAQGTPAPAFGFARILEVMLQRQFPDRRFEVVNVAQRGINSHVILPIARECARYAPDLFLLYLGNNEAVGLYAPDPDGLHVTPYRRLLRATQWVKGTRLAQATENLARALQKKDRKRPEQNMAFFRRSRLAADHPRREAVYDNFEANLDDICRVTRASGAQVLAATVAVNLRDFPPLASLHRPGLSPAELATWDAAHARGTNAEAAGRFEEAITNYLAAARVDDHFAELQYRLGRCAVAAGQAELARKHLSLARDWDALQFRTDTRLNRIVRDRVAARADPGLVLVDAERAFAESALAEQGIPGERIFHEHVHLKFDGDHLLAQTFFPAVVRALNLTNPPPASAPSRQDCAAVLAFSEWDEISVTAAMLRMTAKPPFLDQLEQAGRLARAEQAQAERTRRFQQEDGSRRALEVYRAALARRPADWQIHYNLGSLLNDFGDKPGAAAAYTTAVRFMPVFPALRVLLAQLLWDTGKRDEARHHLKEAVRLAPDYAPARDALAQAGGGRSGR